MTGCDPLARVQILGVIHQLATSGRCVIVSSHVLHEVESLTSQILLQHKGKILAEGSIDHVQNDQRVVEVYLGR